MNVKIEDVELLSRYATEHSEAAFAELTQRHVDLVYSAALRLVNGDVHSAQDVTQQVFTEVARQAKALARHPALVGWLYTTARQMALRANRTEQRRKAREQEARVLAASSACRRPLVQPNGCLLEEPVVEQTQLSSAGWYRSFLPGSSGSCRKSRAWLTPFTAERNGWGSVRSAAR